jgi:hypothetical protein
MTDIYSTPDDAGEPRASELASSLGERLGAQAGEAFMGGMRTFTRMREFGQAESGEETLGSQIGRLQQGEDLNQALEPPRDEDYAQPPVDVPIADAKARVKQAQIDQRKQQADNEEQAKRNAAATKAAAEQAKQQARRDADVAKATAKAEAEQAKRQAELERKQK